MAGPGGPAIASSQVAPHSVGPKCPRCRHREIWVSWVQMADDCPECGLEFGRHGWVAAVWVNTWVTILAVVAWVVGGMVATGARGSAWVTYGAVAIAVVVPILGYRYAKAVTVRVLFHLDPPEGSRHDTSV